MRRLFFIYNPHAGQSRIKSQLSDILNIFTAAGYEVVVHPTQGSGDALECAKNAPAGTDLIVCSGGDGTLDETVTGMMEGGRNIPIGYIPAGSTNDFANSLGIPSVMRRAAQEIVYGGARAVDIGTMNDDFFVYVAAFGIFTDISYKTKQDMKNIFGHMAYIFEGARRLAITDIKSSRLKITYEGGEFEDDFIYGMITNSTSVGGIKGITGSRVRLDDGLFEVTLIRRPDTPLEMQEMLNALYDRKVHSSCLISFKASSLKIDGSEPVDWTLDGEFGGHLEDVNITVMKKALMLQGIGAMKF
ncbi:MAG: diacylglycerol kinase family lipid kinase [Lachnospiraceae bacterium]|nr:diacylglycerol kinase family lipid kinase [Lachnospiraceae bacterium]